MALEDLDLEFEDEDEAKKKKNDAVQVDVDLEFQAPVGGGKPRPVVRPISSENTGTSSVPQARPKEAEVRQIDEARNPNKVISRGPTAPVSERPSTSKSDAHLEFDNSVEVVELRNKMQKVEFDASVKVAIAEFKTEILSELNSDIKLMDHQIGQLLSRIHAKHPDLKQEVLLIKKLLADFTAKKRK